MDEDYFGPASPLFKILSLHLHAGEAEAVALAADMKADIVLIYEQEGRQLAAQAGPVRHGVLGILLRAKLKGEISGLKTEINALRAKAKFFIAPSLETRVLQAAGE